MITSDNTNERKILNAWKEIASYVGRGVRTVQRYESLGLPVIRINRRPRGSVAAFADEINAWIQGTAMRSETPAAPIGRTEWERLSSENYRLRKEVEELRSLVASLQRKDGHAMTKARPTNHLSAA